MKGAQPVRWFHFTSDSSYSRRELASKRLVLSGDAGGFLDPIFTSGGYMASRFASTPAVA